MGGKFYWNQDNIFEHKFDDWELIWKMEMKKDGTLKRGRNSR